MKRLLSIGLLSLMLGSVAFAGGCLPVEGDADTGSFATSIWPLLIFIVVLFGIMYFLMIRPQRRRQKEHQEFVQQLQRGERVVTAGGIHGQIESVGEDSVVIKVESGATLRIAKSSIVVKQGEPETNVG